LYNEIKVNLLDPVEFIIQIIIFFLKNTFAINEYFFLKKIKYFSSTLKLRPPILVTSRIIERKKSRLCVSHTRAGGWA
jgi:hypothetical protein